MNPDRRRLSLADLQQRESDLREELITTTEGPRRWEALTEQIHEVRVAIGRWAKGAERRQGLG